MELKDLTDGYGFILPNGTYLKGMHIEIASKFLKKYIDPTTKKCHRSEEDNPTYIPGLGQVYKTLLDEYGPRNKKNFLIKILGWISVGAYSDDDNNCITIQYPVFEKDTPNIRTKNSIETLIGRISDEIKNVN